MNWMEFFAESVRICCGQEFRRTPQNGVMVAVGVFDACLMFVDTGRRGWRCEMLAQVVQSVEVGVDFFPLTMMARIGMGIDSKGVVVGCQWGCRRDGASLRWNMGRM